MNSLSGIQFSQLSSHFEGFLSILLMVPLAMQQPFYFIHSHVSIRIIWIIRIILVLCNLLQEVLIYRYPEEFYLYFSIARSFISFIQVFDTFQIVFLVQVEKICLISFLSM